MKIYPFRGVLPDPALAGHLITRSYKEYDQLELKSQLAHNPYSFLQLLNPGFRYHRNVRGESRFQLVRNRYVEFLQNQYLSADSRPAFYIYKKTIDGHSYIGIVTNVSVSDYHNGIIKRHEDTIESRVILFKDYLNVVGYNAEPVLMTYSSTDELSDTIKILTTADPDIKSYTTDEVLHELWRVDQSDDIVAMQSGFKAISSLYIADGHHRSASSALLADEMGGKSSNHRFFMSYLISEDQLRIDSYMRLIKARKDFSPEEFLLALDNDFIITDHGMHLIEPKEEFEFLMYLRGKYYRLQLRPSHRNPDPSILNTQVLYDRVLRPLLQIKDPRKDTRLHYLPQESNYVVMKDLIDRGKYDIGFMMIPISISQIKKTADHERVMPPKSTYIRPKLYSGLVIYDYGVSSL